MSESTELTAQKLNEAIVNARKIISTGRVHVYRKLEKSSKLLEKKIARESKEKLIRKKKRIADEIEAASSIRSQPDIVTKFSLTNVEDIETLLANNKDADGRQRLIYKIACSDPVQIYVIKFRQKYNDWATKTPFLLQRLGKKDAIDRIKMKSEEKSDVNVESKKEGQFFKTPRKTTPKDKEKHTNTSITKKIEINPNEAVVRKFQLDEMFASDEDEDRVISFNDVVCKPAPDALVNGSKANNNSNVDDDDFFMPKDAPPKSVKYKGKTKLPTMPLDIDQPIGTKNNKKPVPGQKRKSTTPKDGARVKKSIKLNKTIESLHPSWASKKLQKIEMKNAKPQGKRISFNDQ